jgi:hypothetical protein
MAAAVSLDCAAKKSPYSPESAPTTTPNWNGATWPESPTPCSTPSPAPCNSTKPNTPICTTWRTPPTRPHTRRRATPKQQIRPVIQRILDGITAMPAIVMNVRLDLLSANRLGYALYSPVYDDDPARPVNLARFTFLNPHATALYPDWDLAADTTVCHASHRGWPPPV